MHGAAGRARLMWGLSEAELLFTILWVGVLAAVHVSLLPAVLPRISQVEVWSLATRSKVEWTERWAVEGVRDPRNTSAFEAEQEGKYVSVLPGDAADGSVSYTFNERFSALAGGVITLRPAFSAGEVPFSLIWVCAQAAVPRGFAIRGTDRTDLPATLLIASCRKPLR